MKRLVVPFLVLAALAAPASAGDPLPWGGVGWYVKTQGTYQGAQPYAVAGPYFSQSTCNSVIADRRAQYPNAQMSLWCSYETVAWVTPTYDEYEEEY